jgi:alkylation response protein AidB-like acyl-CoA dehydrogenase
MERTAMDFSTQESAELSEFRRAVGAWLDLHAPPEIRLPVEQALGSPAAAQWVRGFQRALAEQGWVAPSWPRTYGGGGLTPDHDRVVHEERAARSIPDLYHSNLYVARAVLAGGSAGQRRRFVRPLLRGDAVAWYAPSDSDLIADPDAATVQAERDGDVYIVSGAALLTGAFDRPGFLWVLAITDRAAPPPRRLSAFLVPAHLEGITLSPADRVFDGGEHLAMLADVAVPAEYRIGNEGEGQRIARQQYQPDADADRMVERQRMVVARLVQFVREVLKDRQPAARYQKVRQRVAEAYINVNVLRLLSLRNRWVRTQGQEATYQGIQYAVLARTMQSQLAETLLDTLGPHALVSDADLAPMGGSAETLERESLEGAGASLMVQQHLLAESLGMVSADGQRHPSVALDAEG